LNNPKRYVCEYLTIYCHKGRAHNQQFLVFNSKNQRLAEKLYGGGKSLEAKTMMVKVTGFCFLYILHISLKYSVTSSHTAAQIAPERWEENIYNTTNLINFNGTVQTAKINHYLYNYSL